MPGHVAVEVLSQLGEVVRLGSAVAHAAGIGRRAHWAELCGGSSWIVVIASLMVEGCIRSVATSRQCVHLVPVCGWLMHSCVCEGRVSVREWLRDGVNNTSWCEPTFRQTLTGACTYVQLMSTAELT